MKLASEYLDESASDKTDHYHRYGSFYDVIIPSLLCLNDMHPIRILEIGVSKFGRSSGHAFCEMPYVDQFVGIDTQPVSVDFPRNGVFLKGDAYDSHMLEEVARYAPFNLLIDDGSHWVSHQNFFIKQYLKFCAVPGVLAVEDIHTPTGILEQDMVFVKHIRAGADGRIGYILRYK